MSQALQVQTQTITSLDPAGWLGTLSPRTAHAYSSDVRQFSQWLADQGMHPDQVTPGVVKHWLSELASGAATGKPMSAASQARKLSAVRSFWQYARGEGVTTVDPAPFKTPRVERDAADVGAVGKTQAHAIWAATEGKARLRALVAVMMFSGLRVSEATGLQVSDLQEQQGARVLRVMGKGGKPRTAVLPAVSVVALQEWLAVRGDHDGPLFVTRTGAAMEPRGVHREIADLGKRLGIDGLHPHTLRHTFATSAVDAGVDVLRLTTALGHASPTTTMHYLRGRDVVTNSPVHAVASAILGG